MTNPRNPCVCPDLDLALTALIVDQHGANFRHGGKVSDVFVDAFVANLVAGRLAADEHLGGATGESRWRISSLGSSAWMRGVVGDP